MTNNNIYDSSCYGYNSCYIALNNTRAIKHFVKRGYRLVSGKARVKTCCCDNPYCGIEYVPVFFVDWPGTPQEFGKYLKRNKLRKADWKKKTK